MVKIFLISTLILIPWLIFSRWILSCPQVINPPQYSKSLESCLEQCSLPRACSLHNCHLFCDPSDHLCLDTCQSFTNYTVGSCEEECPGGAVVDVKEVQPGTASLGVRLVAWCTVVIYSFTQFNL